VASTLKGNYANLNLHVENIKNDGFTILENIISQDECKIISSKLDTLEEEQRKEFGYERLKALNELGIIRAPISKDDYFANLILNDKVFGLISALIRDTAILHLQNAIITEPNVTHGQAFFHADYTNLKFTSDKIISVSAIWVIDDFDEISGGTLVVPGTHKKSEWPSENYLKENAIQVKAKAGSVIVFDSMLIHSGAPNKGKTKRRAINHMYTRPFVKQQIDLTFLMKGRYDMERKISQVLGFWAIPPKSVHEYRSDPDKRTYRKGQG